MGWEMKKVEIGLVVLGVSLAIAGMAVRFGIIPSIAPSGVPIRPLVYFVSANTCMLLALVLNNIFGKK